MQCQVNYLTSNNYLTTCCRLCYKIVRPLDMGHDFGRSTQYPMARKVVLV